MLGTIATWLNKDSDDEVTEFLIAISRTNTQTFPLFTRFCKVVLSKINDGFVLRRQDRQAVVDGLGESSVSGDGEEGDFAEGERDEMSIPDFPQQKELDEYVGGNPDLKEAYGKAGYSRIIEKQSRELGEKFYSFVKFPVHKKVFFESLDKLENLYISDRNPLTDRMKLVVVDKIATLKDFLAEGYGREDPSR